MKTVDKNCLYSSTIRLDFCSPEKCPCNHYVERKPIGQVKAKKDAN